MVSYENLIKKGYTPREAKRTIEIMQKAEKEKPTFFKIFDVAVYWVLLIVVIIGNLILSIILLPFLLAFKKAPLYITIILIGALFGYLFDQLIKDLERLENKHHIIAWLFIPALAIIDTYYMTSFANYITKTLGLKIAIHSPIIISVIYVISFIAPYIIRNILEITFNKH